MAASAGSKVNPASEGWRQALAGGGLVLAVAAVLIAAAVLEVPEAPAHPASAPAELAAATPAPDVKWQPLTTPLSEIPIAPVPAPDPAPAGVETPSEDPLSRRVLDDPARLHAARGQFTAQLAFACRRDTAERFLARSRSRR